ncbi:hypothetical protein CTAYLR_000995 [Chrysophaeum taylorii]|uniref:Protein MAK16 homolog n=1 Tax=Chrysophaeum taylorii TaxID=2483200 RepID=A0AAD7UH42_9STRA|nr:hypothetical protein CTAYLR_000995 [Chrysophaeum taylorii]
MINDELIWQSLNKNFCSFKSKVQTHNFCRHEMNVTGLCNRSACPLANGRYATIREEEGRCVLYIKTIERAHMPNKLWQKLLLPRNYDQALALVSEHLEHFPKFLVHRNKQRLTRIHQYLIRMRKLALRERPTRVTTSTKVDRREARREQKALVAARLAQSIQSELLDRLRQGTYGDIYNFPETEYNAALNDVQEDTVDDLLDAEDTNDHLVHFVEADLEEEEEENPAIEDLHNDDLQEDDDATSLKRGRHPRKDQPPAQRIRAEPTKRKKKKRRVEIEYDDEEEVLEPPQLAPPLQIS